MLCRALLAAIVILYLICVLFLSGIQNEDLDASLLRKLERRNVNLDDLNNEKFRRECFMRDFKEKSKHFMNSNSSESHIFLKNNITKARLAEILDKSGLDAFLKHLKEQHNLTEIFPELYDDNDGESNESSKNVSANNKKSFSDDFNLQLKYSVDIMTDKPVTTKGDDDIEGNGKGSPTLENILIFWRTYMKPNTKNSQDNDPTKSYSMKESEKETTTMSQYMIPATLHQENNNADDVERVSKLLAKYLLSQKQNTNDTLTREQDKPLSKYQVDNKYSSDDQPNAKNIMGNEPDAIKNNLWTENFPYFSKDGSFSGINFNSIIKNLNDFFKIPQTGKENLNVEYKLKSLGYNFGQQRCLNENNCTDFFVNTEKLNSKRVPLNINPLLPFFNLNKKQANNSEILKQETSINNPLDINKSDNNLKITENLLQIIPLYFEKHEIPGPQLLFQPEYTKRNNSTNQYKSLIECIEPNPNQVNGKQYAGSENQNDNHNNSKILITNSNGVEDFQPKDTAFVAKNLNITTVKPEKLLSADILKQIAENVKQLVLNDINIQLTMMTTTAVTAIASDTVSTAKLETASTQAGTITKTTVSPVTSSVLKSEVTTPKTIITNITESTNFTTKVTSKTRSNNEQATADVPPTTILKIDTNKLHQATQMMEKFMQYFEHIESMKYLKKDMTTTPNKPTTTTNTPQQQISTSNDRKPLKLPVLLYPPMQPPLRPHKIKSTASVKILPVIIDPYTQQHLPLVKQFLTLKQNMQPAAKLLKLKKPVTIKQTNMEEIAPLAIPMHVPVSINNNIVWTTELPFSISDDRHRWSLMYKYGKSPVEMNNAQKILNSLNSYSNTVNKTENPKRVEIKYNPLSNGLKKDKKHFDNSLFNKNVKQLMENINLDFMTKSDNPGSAKSFSQGTTGSKTKPFSMSDFKSSLHIPKFDNLKYTKSETPSIKDDMLEVSKVAKVFGYKSALEESRLPKFISIPNPKYTLSSLYTKQDVKSPFFQHKTLPMYEKIDPKLTSYGGPRPTEEEKIFDLYRDFSSSSFPKKYSSLDHTRNSMPTIARSSVNDDKSVYNSHNRDEILVAMYKKPTYKPDYKKDIFDPQFKLGSSSSANVLSYHEQLEKDSRFTSKNEDWRPSSRSLVSRQQRPLNNIKSQSKYNDKHFKNFLKTQQKVNRMLERILATKTDDDARSTETI